MTLSEFLAFGKTIMTAYDNIITPEQDAAFRADLEKWSAFALNAFGVGIANYMTGLVAKLEAEISKLLGKK